MSDVEAVLCILSLHLPVVYTTFLLYMLPSSYYHRETTTYREVPSTQMTNHGSLHYRFQHFYGVCTLAFALTVFINTQRLPSQIDIN
jgi:hypothetical protein